MTTVAPTPPRPAPGYRGALGALGSWQKSGSGVPAYTRYVNRWLGRHLAAAAAVAGLSPNTVTLVSGAVSAVGIAVVAFIPATWASSCAAAGLLVAGYALDSADGQLARLTGRGSRGGEWLDHVVDAARLPALHLAVGISLAQADGIAGDWPTAVALAFSVVVSVWFFAQILAGQLVGPRARSASGEPVWRSFAKLPVDLGTLYLAVLLLPVERWFVTVYTALFAVSLVTAAGSLVRKYAALEVRESDAAVER